MYKEMAYFFDFPFNCWLTLIVLHIGLFSFPEFLIFRSYHTYSIYSLQKEAKRDYASDLKSISVSSSFDFRKWFVKPSFQWIVISVLLISHIMVAVGKALWNFSDYSTTSGNCVIGQEWLLISIDMSLSLSALFLLLNRIFHIEEELKLIKEFLVSVATMCIFLALHVPALVWSIVKFKKDANEIHANFLFGIDFFFLPLLIVTHMLATLVWPVFLQQIAEGKTNKETNVKNETSMEEYLENEENFEVLYVLAKKLFCVEILGFWKAVSEYKRLIVPGEIEKKKLKIIETFLSNGSVYEVNVSAEVKNAILKEVASKDPNKIIFNKANMQVLRMILENVYKFHINNS